MATTLYRADDHAVPAGLDGECWTAERDVAERYGARLFTLEADIDGSVEVDGYDHAANETPADSDDFRAAHAAAGAVWIDYLDEDDRGRESRTFRLVDDLDDPVIVEEPPQAGRTKMTKTETVAAGERTPSAPSPAAPGADEADGAAQAAADMADGSVMSAPEASDMSDEWIAGYGDALRAAGWDNDPPAAPRPSSAARTILVPRLSQSARGWSSYSDLLADLAVGDRVHDARSCTLITVSAVEHRGDGLAVFSTTEATEFAEPPAAPAKKKRARKPPASRRREGIIGGPGVPLTPRERRFIAANGGGNNFDG